MNALIAGSQSEPLDISVMNGNLRFVRGALMVGHYRSTSLTGTERILNLMYGEALSNSLRIGGYPHRPGDRQLFRNPNLCREDAYLPRQPETIIVVGLGQEGKLSVPEHVATVRQGVVAWVRETVALATTAPQSLTLTTTLLGSGGAGVSAGQAAQAIAQGVRDANSRLCEVGYPCIKHLRIIEIYLDRATEAWRALEVLENGGAPPGQFKLQKTVEAGVGAMQRPLDSSYRGARHDLIRALTRVEAPDRRFIEYSLDTRRARAELRAQHTQDRLLQELIATASRKSVLDNRIGQALFKLVVPAEMEPFLGGTTEVQIELDDGTACIPWELLDTSAGAQDQGDAEPWAIRVKLLRRLLTADFRSEVMDADSASDVLVIGEPKCDPLRYPRLPGAREEAKAVAKRIKEKLGAERVMDLVSDGQGANEIDARRVITTLLSRDWRVIHIAGHGEPADQDGDPRGVVLSSGIYLGPREIRNMRQVPQLVFINCCHSAAAHASDLLASPQPSTYGRAGFAANIAKSLIKIGVRCVVAAGWIVEDRAAREFATTFYKALLDGKRFIDAVAEARKAAWDKFGMTNTTWAAYQCYGDPDWRLQNERDADERREPPHAQEFAGISTSSALVIALEAIVTNAKYEKRSPARQSAKIRYLAENYGKQWECIGSVAEAFGLAYAAVGEFNAARTYLERAIASPDASASMRAGEQLAKVYGQQAWKVFQDAVAHIEPDPEGRDGPEDRSNSGAYERAHESASAQLNKARALLEKLCMFQATAKRHSLCAYICKRIAMVEAIAGQDWKEKDATENMKEQCGKALELAAAIEAADQHYPALNLLAAEINLHGEAVSWETVAPLAQKAMSCGTNPAGHTYLDFRSHLIKVELLIYESVVRQQLAGNLERIMQRLSELHEYDNALERWQSVRDNGWFVLSKYGKRARPDEQRAAATLLLELDRRAGLPALHARVPAGEGARNGEGDTQEGIDRALPQTVP
ncbi:MAG TPA: CHAT domain-containing protein [Noviherbaspirillum sp.]|nr:CHAT domain-containing protein [Noviherbaspirillum sp.]